MTTSHGNVEEFLDRMRLDGQAAAERAELVAEVIASLEPEPHELELVRQEVEAMLDAAFAASWTPERQGFALTTDFSERLKFTSGDEENRLRNHVEDLAFDSDPAVYAAQLKGGAIRKLVAMLTGHEASDFPTAAFLSCAVDLTRHIQAWAGRGRIPGRFIVDTEAHGLSSFDSYLTAAREAEPGAMFSHNLDEWTNGRVSPAVEAQFVADGGPLKLIDNDVLRAGLTESENNAIGALEAAGEPGCGDEIVAVLNTAACRLTGVA